MISVSEQSGGGLPIFKQHILLKKFFNFERVISIIFVNQQALNRVETEEYTVIFKNSLQKKNLQYLNVLKSI